jgi:hypothetical protein
MIPHRVHTTRGPNARTGTSSGQGAASVTAREAHYRPARAGYIRIECSFLRNS